MRGVYIHIPFCDDICSYCDFAKFYYNSNLVSKYLVSLENEIKEKYLGDVVDSIYIGGGTPSVLSYDELERLLKIVSIIKRDNCEFSFECNSNSITEEKLILLKRYGVNRLSIGIETYNKSLLKLLNRKYCDDSTIDLCKKYFDNINVDLIYALPGEDINMLREDIDRILSLDVKHISTYSLILEPNTKLYIDGYSNIDEDIDFEMYDYICKRLDRYNHYETSNFAIDGFESRHNLKYWNNMEYYGFGIGASGYIDGIRYTNTRSINNYLSGNYVLEYENVSKKDDMSNYMILGLRKLDGVSISLFYDKYGANIVDVYDIDDLIEENKLVVDGDKLFISSDYIYLANEILIRFI